MRRIVVLVAAVCGLANGRLTTGLRVTPFRPAGD